MPQHMETLHRDGCYILTHFIEPDGSTSQNTDVRTVVSIMIGQIFGVILVDFICTCGECPSETLIHPMRLSASDDLFQSMKIIQTTYETITATLPNGTRGIFKVTEKLSQKSLKYFSKGNRSNLYESGDIIAMKTYVAINDTYGTSNMSDFSSSITSHIHLHSAFWRLKTHVRRIKTESKRMSTLYCLTQRGVSEVSLRMYMCKKSLLW